MTITQLMQRNWPLRLPATRTAAQTTRKHRKPCNLSNSSRMFHFADDNLISTSATVSNLGDYDQASLAPPVGLRRYGVADRRCT